MKRTTIFMYLIIAGLILSSCKKDKIGEGPSSTMPPADSINKLPLAFAGADQCIVPPGSFSLWGSGTDVDGTVESYVWKQISGPNTATIQNPHAPSTMVTYTDPGQYAFQLEVKDNKGGTGTDIVVIDVRGYWDYC